MTKTTATLFRVHKAYDDLSAMYQANFYEETFDGDGYSRRKFTVKSQSLQTLFHVARKFDAEVWYRYFYGTEERVVIKSSLFWASDLKKKGRKKNDKETGTACN